ncbi:hypothetical protein [Pseudoduganella sp. GCM10020061]|uniref:hypothetical protein n=1 Tax=Pseudoduganella sp. GCM10020061 TaxID=3317345 RepID=UPI0036296FB1
MASTSYYADIQKLYVAYFNRPADVAGLQHWQGVLERTNGDLSLVSNAFAASDEYKVVYAGKSALATVAAVYQNLFGHANDLEGMMWWAERLADGRFTVDVAVTAIAAGAQGSDLVAYNNKVAAATAFTNALDTVREITGYDGYDANARAKVFLSGVTDDASLAAAIEPVALNNAINVVITPPSTLPTFTLAATAASVDEGKTVYFTLNSTNTVAGSEYTYKISGVDASDVVGGALTGTVKLDSTGKAIVAITLSADATTEGIENLTMELAGQTASVIVADTSTTPVTAVTYTLTASATTVDEGGQVTFKLDTTGVAAGTVLSYQLTGIDASRVNGPTSGQVTVDANGQALIVVKTVANAMTDGATTMQLSLVNGQAAVNVGVNDTSLTPTVFFIDSAKLVASNNTGSPVVITTADTGTATVNIASTTSLYAQNGIVIDGNADITVNMGSTNTAGSNETVYVTGSGANTINFSRDSSTSVVLGDGDDKVVTNSLTMVAGQTIDFGAGEDTLDVNGTNNFSTGTLTGVEHVTMHSSAIFSAAQLADIETITELGTDGTLTIAAAGAATALDLTGKLFGEMALVVGSNVTVTLGAAELANITALTTAATAVVTTTVAGAQALLAINANANYSISDTAANLAAAPASVFAGANLQQVSQEGTDSLTIAQAVAVHAAAPAADFTVSATAADLMEALVYETTYETLVSAQATIVVTGTVSVLEAAIFADAGLNTSFVITDTAQHIADNAFRLDAGQISGLALTGSVTADGAASIVALAVDADVAITGLNVVDTAGELLNLAAGTIAAASSIRLAAGEQLTVADATELKTEVGAKLVGGYNLIDSAANIVAKAAIAAGATDIEVTGIVGVAVATQLSKLGNNGNVSFDLVDSPANLAGASAAVLANAASVDVQGTVTVAQATAIANYNVVSFVLVDTAANVLGANATVIAKALANGGHLDVTDATVSAAVASALLDLDAGAVFAVSDTAAALAAMAEANADVLTSATAVTVTGAGTVEQLAAIRDVRAVTGYTLADSAEALLDVDAAGVLAAAGKVSVTGSVTVAEFQALNALASFDDKYSIVDDADAIAALINTGAAGIAVLNASVAPVVLADANVSVATATLLKSATFTNWSGIYNLVDSVANLIGASAAVRNGAGTVTAEGTVAEINTNFAFINANADGYVLVDTVDNLILAGNAIVVAGADAGVATDVANAEEAKALFALNANVEYNVFDTAANLLLAANKAGVQNATTVDIDGPVSVANAKLIAALHADVNYTLQDTAANLALSTSAGTVAGADAIIVTGNATVAQAAAIVAQNDNITLGTITGTVAAIQAADAATTTAAANLVVTDGTRLILSAEEVAHFGQIGGVLTGVTTTVAGASSDDVRYDLVDTFDNLAANITLLADAGKVTVVAGGEEVDVAAAGALLTTLAALGVSASGFAITGTGAAMLANADAVEAAASVVVTGTVSAADAKAIFTLNPAAEYSISSTAAGLVLAANAAAVAAAEEVTVTGDVTVGQIKAIVALNAGADFDTVAFVDTAANLAAAPAGMLAGHNVTVTGAAATVAQFMAITTSDAIVGDYMISVSDTAANLAAADNDALAMAGMITVTGTATAAQAAALAQLTFAPINLHVTFNVSDTAANLITITDGLDAAGTITVTGTVSAAQAVEMAAIEADILTTIDFGNVTVTDTAANLMDLDNVTALTYAANVVVTGTVDVATAAYLNAMIAGNVEYTVVDSVENLIAAVEQTTGGLGDMFNLNAVLGGAESVTITGNGEIEFAEIGGTWYVTGTIAALKALPEAFLDFGYVVNDSVANIVADFGFAVQGQTAYSITDTGANLLAAATSLISGAADITVTGNVTAAAATTIFAANGNATFSITDTVANLTAAGNILSVSNAVAVTASNAATVAQAATLLGRHGDAVFTLSDSAAAMVGNLAVVDEATSVAITGAATSVANLAAIKAVTTVTSYNLTDTAAALVAATAGTVSGATAVTVTGTANGDQAKAIFAAKATAVYSIIENDVAKLFTGNVLNASVSAAVAVDGDLTVNMAQAAALAALGDKFDGSFAVVDTAAAVAAASQAVLDLATDVTVTGTATAAEATAIAALTFGVAEDPISVNIVDTAANLLLAGNATGIAGQDVTVLGTVSVATATSIDTANGAGSITVTALSDTSTNLQLGSADVVNSAGSINVTDTQTVAQAIFLEGNVGAGAEFTFARITDSLANVLGNLGVALDAAVITVTGTASIAQTKLVAANAELSAKLSASLAVADSAANILDAYLDQSFKALVTSAPSITIVGDVSAQQAVLLQGLGNVDIGSLDIVDTITAINGLSAGLINLSDSVTATVDTDLARQVFSDAGMTTSATIVYSNGAAADGAQVTVTSPGVYDTTAADILTLKAGDLVDLSAFGLMADDGDGILETGEYLIVRGNVSNGGNTFTQSGTGTSTLVIWDADTTAGVHSSGVILVGQSGTQLTTGEDAAPSSLVLDVTPGV